MKKIGITVFIFLCLFRQADAGPLRVVTTTEDLASIAREVGGSLVVVESLTRGSQDPHFLEARPSLILKTSRADLFIQVGMGLEAGWAPALLTGARNPTILPGNPGHLDGSLRIEPLEIPPGPVDRSQGDVHPFGNPHYWLDPENGRILARAVASHLTERLPDQSSQIEKNLSSFLRRLDEGMARWTDRMRPYRGAKVVTYHRSWSYFARRFGLEVVGYVEPKPGIPPSPAYLQGLIGRMKQEGVRVVVMEPYFGRALADLLSRETGAKVLTLPPSVGGAEGVNTYPDLFDHLVGRLTSAFPEGR
jgi:ABC-type Zn uptake system ZnuABC Zn-binding protein ZnuA